MKTFSSETSETDYLVTQRRMPFEWDRFPVFLKELKKNYFLNFRT